MAIEAATTLLERERELAALRAALHDAEERRGRVLVIEAPAGLGKTTLLGAAGAAAEDAGFTRLRARANDLERDFAYGCVRQLFEPAVAAASDGAGLFDGAAALSRSLFEPSSGPSVAAPTADTRFSMLHGLYWLLNNLAAERPAVLLVDDLHWADPESLRFLAYLAPRLDGLAVAVVATTRPGEGDVAAVARLAAAPEATVIRPRPLTREATALLCEHRLAGPVSPEFAAACRDATGGNPFFLEALLREVLDRGLPTDAATADRVRGIGPAAVARAVVVRLASRPPAATALVRAVAMLGDGAPLADTAALAGLSDDEAAEAADLLVALEIFKPAPGLEFAHAIVHHAVCQDMGPRERAAEHARAAALLSSRGAPAERVAAQIAAADPAGDAARVEVLRRVAADALVRGAPAAAVAWLTRALAEPPPPERLVDVLLELGSAELRLGAPASVEHLRAAVERISEPVALTTATRQLALSLSVSGDPDAAVAVLARAIEQVEPDDRELALELEAELASHAQQASPETRAPAAERLERRKGLQGRTRGERLVLASRAYERARASESERDAAAELEAALDGGRLLEDLRLDIAGAFYDVVIGLLATDSLDVAEACLDRALADARARGSIPAVAFAIDRRGWVALRRGDVARAEADARTGLELLTSHGIALGVPLALALLIRALIEAGEVDEAERALRGSGLGADIRPALTTTFLLEARARLDLAAGRTRAGVDGLVAFGRVDEQWGGANALASRWRSECALALVALGEGGEARALAAEDLERARRWGAASGVGVALRAVALVEGGSSAVGRLREAADVLARSPARLEHARALTDLGAALRRGNQRAEARGALAEAIGLADRLGARALADRARVELRAAGGRSSDPDGAGVERLTASERRVAELAARGQSNPEIAQALFVTRKTVETHLGHVYAKLGIARRGQLPRALAGEASGA